MTTVSIPSFSVSPRTLRPTMRQVASLAGVGIKTVSRVINGEAGVSAATHARVTAAIEALNYQHDIYAGSLRRSDRRTLTIGLIVGNVANPFSGALNRAVEDSAARHGIAVLAVSLDDDASRERELVSALLRRRVDAVILTSVTSNQSYLLPEIAHGTPFVFVDREPVGVDADVVVSDNAVGAAAATRHLLDHGHRRIAFLGDRSDIQTSRERRRGFFEALGTVGIPTDTVIAIDDIDDESKARAAVVSLLDLADPPTAIFSGQNLITVGAIRALHERAAHTTTALVGFDDLLLADMLEPAITVVAQNPTEIGTIAAERALARLGGDEGAFQTYVVPTRLIIRGSGEITPRGRA
ncbi:MAG TPA: LacI family DNA-binding transcriptional regulator [Galbitalea sp.]